MRQQHRLRLSDPAQGALLVVVAAALAVAVAPAANGAASDSDAPQVAECKRAHVQHGGGPADWRRRSIVAGRLGVARRPLGQMQLTPSGWLTSKMPVLVAGHAPVTLSVPQRLRRRVVLFYGPLKDRAGRPTRLIGRGPGFRRVEFRPCTNLRRTVWLGGIMVRGRLPVQLRVSVEGEPGSTPLRLGRPQVLRPRAARTEAAGAQPAALSRYGLG